jgi:hypothetical protein
MQQISVLVIPRMLSVYAQHFTRLDHVMLDHVPMVHRNALEKRGKAI